jgi:hypothetical protein
MTTVLINSGTGTPILFQNLGSGQSISFLNSYSLDWGSVSYTTPGTYSWTAPAGVTSVCAVCIGGGASGTNTSGNGTEYGGNSYFINTTTVMGIGGPRNGSGVGTGVTVGGALQANTRAKLFVDQVKGRPVHLGISGRTLEFDGNGSCVAGGC